jgi:putative endonuclease
MIDSYKRGLLTEWMARIFLKFKFYQILYIRYKTPLGEIDIICRKNNTIIFCEVKYRKSLFQDESVVQNKQIYRIKNAASFFLARNVVYNSHDMRFDLLIINNNLSITHHRNVW